MSIERKMNKDVFWTMIDEMRVRFGENMQAAEKWMIQELKQYDAEDIITYQYIFLCYKDAADKYGLWSAASVMIPCCTDDGFNDFRAWLIAQGENNFYNSLRNPDCLANLKPYGYCRFEGMNYIGVTAYEQLTGDDLYDKITSKTIAVHQGETAGDIIYHPLIEYPLDIEDLEILFPQLCNKNRRINPSVFNSKGSLWNLNHARIKNLWEKGKEEVKRFPRK